MQVGTGSRSAPCLLGYREVRQGMKPWPLANPPSTPPTPLGILIPTPGKGKALARGGRGGKGRRLFPAGTLKSALPPDQGAGPALCHSKLCLSPPRCARVPGGDCTCVPK